MATIRATCTSCGDRELTTDDVVVVSHGNSLDGQYRFVCSECGMITLKHAEERTLDLLVASGCEVERHEVSPEIDSIQSMAGEPFTEDCEIDFHEIVEDAAKWESFLDGCTDF